MRPLFAVEGVGKRFGERVVLKNASAWVHAGRITALFGRNGSGKSTLLRCAVGALPLDHGVVHFGGDSFLRPRLSRLARAGLMYVPAEGALIRGRALLPQLEGVAWRFRGGPDLDEVLARLALTHLVESTTDELSGGEQRRASVALAVVRDPRCLLIDEPFAGIAPKDGDVIDAELRRLAGRGCGILITGHEVTRILDVADDVVWMVAGTTHGLGDRAGAVAHEQFRREYLGPRAPNLEDDEHTVRNARAGG